MSKQKLRIQANCKMEAEWIHKSCWTLLKCKEQPLFFTSKTTKTKITTQNKTKLIQSTQVNQSSTHANPWVISLQPMGWVGLDFWNPWVGMGWTWVDPTHTTTSQTNRELSYNLLKVVWRFSRDASLLGQSPSLAFLFFLCN